MTSNLAKPQGIVYTFYSFKGGVGRTMALANVAALLAKWGHSVLVVDWDLEAPGIERFFCADNQRAMSARTARPGIVDLIACHRDGAEIDWQDCVHTLPVNGRSLSVITSGREDGQYAARLQSLNFGQLFEENDLGAYIERLRNAWINQFDFVLIDSRTGVTDIGGICTVHLADVLVLLFTATDSSTQGAKDIIERARIAQSKFPVDRAKLLAVPVPARDESRTEYERALQWKRTYAEEFGEFYADWLPSGVKPMDAIEMLKIPYVPNWSFGERLPVIEEGTNNPGTLGYSYQILARLLSSRLAWDEALKPQSNQPTTQSIWLTNHRSAAQLGLMTALRGGYMETWHRHATPGVLFDQRTLLDAALQAQVGTSSSIGLVLNDEKSRPKPRNDGIAAEIYGPDSSYDYWAISREGTFYSLMSLQTEEDEISSIFYNLRIQKVAEALRHCASLYKALGLEPTAEVTFEITLSGLKGRALKKPKLYTKINRTEDQYSAEVTFRLSTLDAKLLELTMALCRGLFLLFDFQEFPEAIYAGILSAVTP